MASSAATSRIRSPFKVAAASAPQFFCSSSSKAAAQVASSSAHPFPKLDADPNPSLIHPKLPLLWTFCKHAGSPLPGEVGASPVDPGELFNGMDPLSKIKKTETELLKTRGAQSPSPLKLIFLGGPGVGKGSYASLASMRLGIPHISTGDLVRKEVYKSPSSCCTVGEMVLQQAVRTAMNQGKLVSDEIIFKLLSEQLHHMDPDVGFILDGFPRTISQARVLDEAVGGVDMAINFHLEDDILVAKCLGRRTCTECGKDYNLAHVDICTHELTAKGLMKRRRIFLPARPPPSECASTLKVRGDDTTEAAVRERLRAYARESEPLEQHYRSQGKLVDLDAGPGAEYVWPRLMDSISELENGIDYMDSYYH